MEQWKEIPDTGGRYSISNLGRVRTNKTGYIRKSCLNNKTGVSVCSLSLRENGQRYIKTVSISREVARAFLPSFKEDMIVRFKDGDCSNCSVSNLYMGYQSDILKEILTCAYLITHPDGTQETVKGIEQWCKENNKDRSRLSSRKFIKGAWKGYNVEKLD